MSPLPLDLGSHELNGFQRECCHVAEVGLCRVELVPLLGDGSKVVSTVVRQTTTKVFGMFTDLHAVGPLKHVIFAFKVFRQELVEQTIQRVSHELRRWGYGTDRSQNYAAHALCGALLLNRSPCLEDLTTEVIAQARQENIALYLIRRLRTGCGRKPRQLKSSAAQRFVHCLSQCCQCIHGSFWH